jgi:hypothetical protein
MLYQVYSCFSGVSVYQLFRQNFKGFCPLANESLIIFEEQPKVIVDLKSGDQDRANMKLNMSRAQIEPLPIE